jgi:adenylate cyclase
MGLVPGYDGRWTPSALAYVRVVARLRARGHTLEKIKQASDNGQLAIGPIENMLRSSEPRHSLKDAARASGVKPRADRADLLDDGPGHAPAGRDLR